MKTIKMRPTITAVLTATALLISGCHHTDHDHEHEHEGHSHSETLYLSNYGGRYEIFAPTTPLSIGNECHIQAHITLLENFKPLGEGKVTVTLTVGGKKVSQTCDKPTEPGIFEFNLTPPAKGKASLSFTIESNGITDTQTIDGLTVYADEHEAHEAAEESEAHISNGAAFSKEMSWKIDFSTDVATIQPFGDIIHATGKIEPSAGNVSTIVARTAGTVRFNRQTITEGASVKAGESLFTINPEVTPDGSMKVRIRQAESDYKQARDAYERGRKLKEEGVMSESELAQLRNAYEIAEASYHHLGTNFGSGSTSASSGISGYLTQINVTNGQYVEAGQPLATVASNRDLFVRADIPVRFARRLGSIISAGLKPVNESEYIEIAGKDGGIVSVGQGVSEGTQMVPVVFRMPNRSGLLPGEFVDMLIRTSGGEPALTIPSDALIEQQGTWFVYVQIHPELFEKRSVKPGRTDGVNTEILSGLKEGERVVGHGAIMVKLSQASGALDAHAGHVH